MATVEIPDELFDALRADSKHRHRTDDPTWVLVQLASNHLREVCAPGFDHDGLTGLLTRHALRQRLNEATFGTSWTDDSLYRERFLCIDLDNFKRFLDVHGLPVGDRVLRHLGHDLRDRFGVADVYRFGGDEFVVVLGERDVCLPEALDGVTVTHALVEVGLRRSQHRNHHVNRWIELHLDAGILAATPKGTRVECGSPVWLEQP